MEDSVEYSKLTRDQLYGLFPGRHEPCLVERAKEARRSRGEVSRITGWYAIRGSSAKSATCYVCGRTITTWGGDWSITKSALIDLLEHRDRHASEVGEPPVKFVRRPE